MCAFFIVSGFYISMIIDEKYSRAEHGVRTFFINRALRLLPAYWAVLVLGAILMAIGIRSGDWSAFAPTVSFIRRLAAFADNALLFPGAAYYGTIAQPLGLPSIVGREILTYGQCFTIGFEILFYMAAPFIVRLSTRAVAIAFVLSLAVHITPYFLFAPDNALAPGNYRAWQYEFPPGVLVFFILGCLSYRLYLKVRTWHYPTALGWASLPLLVLAVTLGHDGLFWRWTSTLPAVVVYGLLALTIPFLFNASRQSKIDRMIGDASYPIYLNHLLAIYLALTILPTVGSASMLLAIGISIGLALISLLLIEWPIGRFRAALIVGRSPERGGS